MLQLYGKPIFTIDGTDDDLQIEQVIDFCWSSGGMFAAGFSGARPEIKLLNPIVVAAKFVAVRNGETSLPGADEDRIGRPRASKFDVSEPATGCGRKVGLFTSANTCPHMKTFAPNTNTNTNTNTGAGPKFGLQIARAPVGEIPTEAEAVEMTAAAGIPPDFARLVYQDWSSRSGKDGAGNVVPWLPYVTKRWAREQVEWKAGTHRGRKAQGPGATVGPAFLEVAAYAREKWGDDPRRANWAVSFYQHWNDSRRQWKRNGVLIDWKIELTAQVAKWRGCCDK